MIGILQDGITADIALQIFAFILAIIFCMTIHEYAHARVAYMQGDDTAYRSGRMTLNPVAHIDPYGFIILILCGFGWAKPVPINPVRFKNYRKGIFLTSIAGIVANIYCAFFCAGLYVLVDKLIGLSTDGTFIYFLLTFLEYLFFFGVLINVNLALFNLIPIPPLDGYNVLKVLCKRDNKFVKFVERYHLVLSVILLIICYAFSVISICSYFIYLSFFQFWSFVWVF